MSKQVLFISIDGMTDPLGQSQVIPYLSGLSKAGYSITILSAEKKSKLSTTGKKIQEILNSDSISWQHVDYKSKVPFFSQVRNYFSLYRTAKKIVKDKNTQLIHARSYLPALIALGLKKSCGVPFLFDMRGFWADERVEGNIWDTKRPLHKWLYNYFKRKETEFLRESSHIISLTNNAKQEIVKQHPDIDPEKISVIPCCADFSLFNYETSDPETIRALRKKTGLNETDLLLTYSGSLGTWYMLPEMLRFFKVLLKHKPSAKFLFLTTDSPEVVLNEAAKQNIPVDCIRIASATRDEMPVYLNMSSLCVFFIRPGFSKKASSPTKLAEILGCGIPVVTNSGIGDVDALLKEHHCGFLLSDFDEKNFTQTIELIDTEIFNKAGLRATALKNFDLNSGINSYISVYKKILYG